MQVQERSVRGRACWTSESVRVSSCVGRVWFMTRLLLVEDDRDLADTLADALRVDGFRVDAVHDGALALPAALHGPYDVVILDRDLPGMHGDAVCRALVARRATVKILMLTAASGLYDRVGGLDLGADDYLTKPFAYPELVARLRALSRRSDHAASSIIAHGGARLDCSRRTLEVDGLPIALTLKEIDVLEALMRESGGSLSTERLLRTAWDNPFERTHGAVRVVIHSLRKKLGEAVRIEHSPGRGYYIAVAA